MNANGIKKIRKEFGLTQTQFAKAVGVSFATVNRWERGHNIPHPVWRKRLAHMRRVSSDIEHGIMPRESPNAIIKKWSRILGWDNQPGYFVSR